MKYQLEVFENGGWVLFGEPYDIAEEISERATQAIRYFCERDEKKISWRAGPV